MALYAQSAPNATASSRSTIGRTFPSVSRYDEELRRRALLDRAVPSVNYRARTAAELLEQVAALAHRLEVVPPGLGEIRRRAESLGETERAATLVAWQAEFEVVACDDA